MVLEKTLESHLDCKVIQPVPPKGNQSWKFTGRTDAEAESPILWPLDGKNCLIGNDPDAGKDWRQEKKGATGDEIIGWHHQLSGQEFEQALGVGDGQGSLVCCSPWGWKELSTTEWLNWKKKKTCLLNGLTKESVSPFYAYMITMVINSVIWSTNFFNALWDKQLPL